MKFLNLLFVLTFPLSLMSCGKKVSKDKNNSDAIKDEENLNKDTRVIEVALARAVKCRDEQGQEYKFVYFDDSKLVDVVSFDEIGVLEVDHGSFYHEILDIEDSLTNFTLMVEGKSGWMVYNKEGQETKVIFEKCRWRRELHEPPRLN